MVRVILESPFAGNVEENVGYARACLRDCLLRGEAPIASHLLYTQPGVLDDTNPEERKLGIEAGLTWGALAEKTVAYLDRGISGGMQQGIKRAEKEGRPVKYRTLHPIKIATITGPSGAGKTSIAGKLMELMPGIKPVVSLTTRKPRPSDLPGEYVCGLDPEEFEKEEGFLWVARVHGNTYGTLKGSVDDAFESDAVSFMLLVPEKVRPLRDYAETKLPGSVISFYIVSPPPEELRRRLKERGDENDEAVERRILDCKSWDEEAEESSIPYIFISNEKRDMGEGAARLILTYLTSIMDRD